MQRLSGLDAVFLYLETPIDHMHIALLGVVDPRTAPRAWDATAVRRLVAQRLHLLPPLRRRLARVPLGLDHPRWIDEPAVDLDVHVRRAAVPRPGGPAELAELTGHLLSLPLDLDRPPWELWVLDGLADDHAGLLFKSHHAAIDGIAAAAVALTLMDASPRPRSVPPPLEPPPADPPPTLLRRLGWAARGVAREPLVAGRAARLVWRAVRHRRRAPAPPALPLAPRTPFNSPLTCRREVALADLPLEEVRRVASATGTTVNDVVLAVCAGALREWLQAHGRLPSAPLVALVPRSVRPPAPEGATTRGGNRLLPMLVPLPTHVDAPLARLGAAHAAAVAAKAWTDAVGGPLLATLPELALPVVVERLVHTYSRRRLAAIHRPVCNLTISNVPGPPVPLYCAGARVVAAYPFGPVFDGVGLNITVASYLDRLHVGITGGCDGVHVAPVAEGLHRALTELDKLVP